MQAAQKTRTFTLPASLCHVYHLRHPTTYRVSAVVAHYVSHGSSVQTSIQYKFRPNMTQSSSKREEGRRPASPNGSRDDAASSLGQTVFDRIGNTPLLRLTALTTDLPGVTLLGKAEWYNPGGSVKDRAASNIVAEGRRSGKFQNGKVLLDSTSGNTGIAYAMLGAAEGFPVTLCMPENVSLERKHILHAYGANIIYIDPADGSDGAILQTRALVASHPETYFYADQYSNDANRKAHY